MKGKGTFNVEMSRNSDQNDSKGIVQKFTFQKKYKGDLKGESTGEMLSHMTPVEGSAGYVAIEHFKGVFNGAKGSFVLQHYGVMDAGEDQLIVEIIPDSGEGELKGLRGTMTIDVKNGEHYYEIEIKQDKKEGHE